MVDFYNCRRCNEILCDDMGQNYVCVKCKEGHHSVECGDIHFGKKGKVLCGDCFSELCEDHNCNFCGLWGDKIKCTVTCKCRNTFCTKCFTDYFEKDGLDVKDNDKSLYLPDKIAQCCNWCPAPAPIDACKICWRDREIYVSTFAGLCKAHNAKRMKEEEEENAAALKKRKTEEILSRIDDP